MSRVFIQKRLGCVSGGGRRGGASRTRVFRLALVVLNGLPDFEWRSAHINVHVSVHGELVHSDERVVDVVEAVEVVAIASLPQQLQAKRVLDACVVFEHLVVSYANVGPLEADLGLLQSLFSSQN